MKYALIAVLVAACGGSTPQVRYYQLASTAPSAPKADKSGERPARSAAEGGAKVNDRVLVVDALTSDTAYDDERIVYRNNPYKLEYYNYHRWVSSPGALVSGYLGQALARTGDFKAVLREQTADASLVLGGRIVALEEVDQDKTHWIGRVALELTLTDPKTGEVVWAQPFEETEPLAMQNPEGLARAVSTALDRIAKKAAPEIAERAATTKPVASASK